MLYNEAINPSISILSFLEFLNRVPDLPDFLPLLFLTGFLKKLHGLKRLRFCCKRGMKKSILSQISDKAREIHESAIIVDAQGVRLRPGKWSVREVLYCLLLQRLLNFSISNIAARQIYGYQVPIRARFPMRLSAAIAERIAK